MHTVHCSVARLHFLRLPPLSCPPARHYPPSFRAIRRSGSVTRVHARSARPLSKSPLFRCLVYRPPGCTHSLVSSSLRGGDMPLRAAPPVYSLPSLIVWTASSFRCVLLSRVSIDRPTVKMFPYRRTASITARTKNFRSRIMFCDSFYGIKLRPARWQSVTSFTVACEPASCLSVLFLLPVRLVLFEVFFLFYTLQV